MTIPPTAAKPDQPGAGDWENEGGSVKPAPHPHVPAGIIPEHSTRYRVGAYSYSRLEDAMAELDRQSGD